MTLCETSAPGLYAAGDAATRELVTGSRSGGGSHNGAWAMSSGTIAGRAAVKFAKRAVAAPRDLRSAARAGIPESGARVAPGGEYRRWIGWGKGRKPGSLRDANAELPEIAAHAGDGTSN